MTAKPERPPRRSFAIRHRLPAAACVLVTMAAMMPASGAQAAPALHAQVRVNQIGYAAGAPKRAYLMTSGAVPDAAFRVVDSHGVAAYASGIGADQGSWSSTYSHVYALDFDTVHRTGSYRIVVSDGSMQVRSPAFRIDSAAHLYAAAMANSLAFYQNERDGARLHPIRTATGPGAPQRCERDDLSHSRRQRQRQLQG